MFTPHVPVYAVRMALERCGEHPSPWAAIQAIAGTICSVRQTLQTWVKQNEGVCGGRNGESTVGARRFKLLVREVR